MHYPVWLFGISALFMVLERAMPRREQKLLRQGWVSDLIHITVNSHWVGVAMGILVIQHLPDWNTGWAGGWPVWAQIALLAPAFDLSQWCVHNMLHRVPALWEIHKVHHSSRQLDWLANWRFHFLEAVIYRSALYVPLALAGFSGEALFANGLLGTVMGHYAHANFRLHPGPVKYVLNSPQMHLWHHVHASAGPVNKNFGIAFSCWDWIFGTAYMPDNEPERLGFAGDETYPESWWGQTFEPMKKALGKG